MKGKGVRDATREKRGTNRQRKLIPYFLRLQCVLPEENAHNLQG